MRHPYFKRSGPRPPRVVPALVALAALGGPLPAALAQGVDPTLAQLQQQLQPMSGEQLLAPAEASPPQPEPEPVAQAQPAAMAPQPAPPPEPARPRRSTIGPATVAWLDLQRSNRAAAPEAHPFEGAAASSAYQRYLQSFTKPIPTWFTSTQRSSGGGSSSGGDMQSQ